jgi:hypothetical protein
LLIKGLNIPVGKFYLGDTGYALILCCLTPYCGTWYHLKEFAKATEKPKTEEELFDLHPQLNKLLEIVKKRFPILKNMGTVGYNFSTPAKLVDACFAVHNFIQVNQGYLDEYNLAEDVQEE